MTEGGRASGRFLWIAWTPISGRAGDIASSLGGEARIIFPTATSKTALATVWRYSVSFIKTIVAVVRAKPTSVIVTNPPVIAGLAAWLGAALVGSQFFLDSHPGGFGLQGDTFSRRLQWLHRWLTRRADAVFVTTHVLADLVRSWGAEAAIVHEAPPPIERAERRAARVSMQHQLNVFVPTIFGRDEPIEPIFDAARLLPGLLFRVTGSPERLDRKLLATRPANVELLGFLEYEEFLDELIKASVVLVLTVEDQSVPRAAAEAVFSGIPLVVSDSLATRRYFPLASHVPNSSMSVSSAISTILSDDPEICRRRAMDARELIYEAWIEQRCTVERLLADGPRPSHV